MGDSRRARQGRSAADKAMTSTAAWGMARDAVTANAGDYSASGQCDLPRGPAKPVDV